MYSKETANLKLPQWIPTDHPDFLTDMNQAFNTLDKKLGDDSNSIEHLQETVEALSEHMTTIQSEFDEVKAKVDALENIDDNPTVKKLVEDMAQAQTDIDGLKSSVNTNSTDISVLKSQVASITSDVSKLKQDAESLDTRISDLEDSIDALNTSVGQISTRLTALETRMTAVETVANGNAAEIADIKTEQETQNTDIQGLKDKNIVQDADIESLKNRVSNVEGSGGETSDELAVLTRRVSSNETSIINLQSEVSGLDTRTENLEDMVNMLTSFDISHRVYKYNKDGNIINLVVIISRDLIFATLMETTTVENELTIPISEFEIDPLNNHNWPENLTLVRTEFLSTISGWYSNSLSALFIMTLRPTSGETLSAIPFNETKLYIHSEIPFKNSSFSFRGSIVGIRLNANTSKMSSLMSIYDNF